MFFVRAGAWNYLHPENSVGDWAQPITMNPRWCGEGEGGRARRLEEGELQLPLNRRTAEGEDGDQPIDIDDQRENLK